MDRGDSSGANHRIGDLPSQTRDSEASRPTERVPDPWDQAEVSCWARGVARGDSHLSPPSSRPLSPVFPEKTSGLLSQTWHLPDHITSKRLPRKCSYKSPNLVIPEMHMSDNTRIYTAVTIST